MTYLLSTRHPAWKVAGAGVLVTVAGLTAYYATLGPRALEPARTGDVPGQGTQGRYGTFVEQLGQGRFALSYDTIQGTQSEITLDKVTGRLEEPGTRWDMVSPRARRVRGVWTLLGPLDVKATDVDAQAASGAGRIQAPGPALAWDHGVWTGLAPLVWDDLIGNGRGRWVLPPGWRRGLDGVFHVDKGPVVWTAADPGTLQTLTAQRMESALGFRTGHLEEVDARLQGGAVQAGRVLIQAEDVVFDAPVRFQRTDGWVGSAGHGRAPRPAEGKPFEQVEFRDFKATRPLPGGGQESVQALGARWTPAGLRLEGDVRLQQPVDGTTALLRAPRVLQRTGPGDDLPEGLPAGETWAEPQAVLTWGQRGLSSPRIQARHAQRTWLVRAPALGRGELGTFSAGEGKGDPTRWEFQGPIQARFLDGGTVRADHLTWEGAVMTVTGRPATWVRPRQRLAGLKVVYSKDLVKFPQGVSGALAAQEGDVNLRADQGMAVPGSLDLDGRVEAQGQGWRLQAAHISVTLGPGNIVKQMTATGSVVLKGKLGEGRGDVLDLDPVQQTATWHGAVRSTTEVPR